MTSRQKGIGPSKNLEILLALWHLKEDDTLYPASDIAKLMYDPTTQKYDKDKGFNAVTLHLGNAIMTIPQSKA